MARLHSVAVGDQRLTVRFFHSRSEKQLGELIALHNELTQVGWREEDVLRTVISVADKLNISEEVRSALCEYPPIDAAIARHRDDMYVKSFLRDDDVPMFEFPGESDGH